VDRAQHAKTVWGTPKPFGVPQNSTFLFVAETRSKANAICGHAVRVYHQSFRPIRPVVREKHAKTIWGTPKPFGVPQNSTFLFVAETRSKANTICGHAVRVYHQSFRPIGSAVREKHAKTIWGTPKPFGVPQNSAFAIRIADV
jgi:hypothetical protein